MAYNKILIDRIIRGAQWNVYKIIFDVKCDTRTNEYRNRVEISKTSPNLLCFILEHSQIYTTFFINVKCANLCIRISITDFKQN